VFSWLYDELLCAVRLGIDWQKPSIFCAAALAAMQAVPDHGANKTKDVPPVAAVITMSVTASTTRRLMGQLRAQFFRIGNRCVSSSPRL
jgi:hypothetical protein